MSTLIVLPPVIVVCKLFLLFFILNYSEKFLGNESFGKTPNLYDSSLVVLDVRPLSSLAFSLFLFPHSSPTSPSFSQGWSHSLFGYY